MAEYLGTEAQQRLLGRGRAMYDIVGSDPTYSYYGRTVGLAEIGEDGLAPVIALARLQGNASVAKVPETRIPELWAAAEAEGLVPVHYLRWMGGGAALARAEAILAETSLPNGLEIVAITPDTDPEVVSAFGAMALACGVLPPAVSVLGGRIKPGCCLVVRTGQGHVVSCAGAAAHLHPDHPDGRRECWWGMLATDPAYRGARLSLILGARVLLEMRDRYGFTAFMTGVEPGNAPSEAVCHRIGFERTDQGVLGAADASLLPGGRMTK